MAYKSKEPPLTSIGDIYGDWTVIIPGERQYQYATVKRCCGKVKNVRVESLIKGASKSCGCKTALLTKAKKHQSGYSYHKLYPRWNDMIRRCYDSKRKDYHLYGGKGVTVCGRLCGRSEQEFFNFVEDMEKTFHEGLELERIDVRGNYSPSNCRWENRSIQCQNQHKTRGITSKYIGVSLHKKTGAFQASVRVNYKDHYIGLFNDQRIAAMCRDLHMLELRGS